MGNIINTNIEGLELEKRKESFYISESGGGKEHIFTYETNGLVEISKDFLKKILKYFNKHKGELK